MYQFRIEQIECRPKLSVVPTTWEAYIHMNNFSKKVINEEICHFYVARVAFVIGTLHISFLLICTYHPNSIENGENTFLELAICSIFNQVVI